MTYTYAKRRLWPEQFGGRWFVIVGSLFDADGQANLTPHVQMTSVQGAIPGRPMAGSFQFVALDTGAAVSTVDESLTPGSTTVSDALRNERPVWIARQAIVEDGKTSLDIVYCGRITGLSRREIGLTQGRDAGTRYEVSCTSYYDDMLSQYLPESAIHRDVEELARKRLEWFVEMFVGYWNQVNRAVEPGTSTEAGYTFRASTDLDQRHAQNFTGRSIADSLNEIANYGAMRWSFRILPILFNPEGDGVGEVRNLLAGHSADSDWVPAFGGINSPFTNGRRLYFTPTASGGGWDCVINNDYRNELPTKLYLYDGTTWYEDTTDFTVAYSQVGGVDPATQNLTLAHASTVYGHTIEAGYAHWDATTSSYAGPCEYGMPLITFGDIQDGTFYYTSVSYDETYPRTWGYDASNTTHDQNYDIRADLYPITGHASLYGYVPVREYSVSSDTAQLATRARVIYKGGVKVVDYDPQEYGVREARVLALDTITEDMAEAIGTSQLRRRSHASQRGQANLPYHPALLGGGVGVTFVQESVDGVQPSGTVYHIQDATPRWQVEGASDPDFVELAFGEDPYESPTLPPPVARADFKPVPAVAGVNDTQSTSDRVVRAFGTGNLGLSQLVFSLRSTIALIPVDFVDLAVDFEGQIVAWSLVGGASGNINLDIKRATSTTFPGSLASIKGTATVGMTGAANATGDTTDWTRTRVSPGDILRVSVVSGTLSQATLSLQVRRS